ncbi:MAG: hypothetical protein LIO71_06680 [Ruminococcus sp.]|nr:hypothetical protein [Ruminococcus sp.]MCD7800803.1 hypothetical protein [Ruminococcus sp.]
MKKIFIILGAILTLTSFSGCSSSSETTDTDADTTTTTEETSETSSADEEFLVRGNTISDEYSELFNTWYSAYDIIAFTDDGEFYLTYDDIGYCVYGTYSIEDDILKVVIDPSSIKSNDVSVGDTDYKFEFVDGNLILTLAEDDTQSLTYYLDKSVALGETS